ncbi:MAG: pyridoxal-phosphate-dependent aminotransferase family protein [Thermovirgaceae bacterium]
MTKYLFTPGPVQLDAAVQAAMAEPVTSHRSREFPALLLRLQNRLRDLLRTRCPVPVVPGSGTGALEALAVNLVGPHSKVLSFSCGVFGDRFREIVRRRGAEVMPFDIEPGRACLPDDVANACRSFPDADLLLLTHNETSTGVLNPIEEICRALPDRKPLVLVDAVSSLGVVPVYPEKWGIDAMASCSQKGLGAPPGLGILWLSSRARDVLSKGLSAPTVFFDLSALLSALEKEEPSFPYTPPVTILRALDAALDGLARTGYERRFEAARRFARTLVEGFSGMGLELFVTDGTFRSPGVTSVKIPGKRADDLREILRDLGIETAGGQGGLKGDILRIGHFCGEGWPEVCLLLGSFLFACKKAKIPVKEPDLGKCLEVFAKEEA